MLYVTTRTDNDAYTPRHPLTKDRAPDGGLYAPFQNIRYSEEQISALAEKSFGQCAAGIINHFFSTKLTGWEVDFALGRKPFRLVAMNHKILVGELFNNPGNDFSWTVRKLRDLVVSSAEVPEELSQWTWIAVRIAALFGIFGELIRLSLAGRNRTIDVAVASGDFSVPMSVLYAKEMGLPIGNILFGCDDSSGAWDFIHHGEIHTGRSQAASLERLIYMRLGRAEASRYGQSVFRKGMHAVSEEARRVLSEDFFGAVVSGKRMRMICQNVSRTYDYSLHSDAALAYGALQDFRAAQNEIAPAIILTEFSPDSTKD